jgi:predicted RecB family nuclease
MPHTTFHVTNDLFDAFLVCGYKSHLLAKHTRGRTTDYASLESRLIDDFRNKAKIHLAKASQHAVIVSTETESLSHMQTGTDLIFNLSLTDNKLHSQIDAATKVPGKSALGRFYYEPIVFCRNVRVAKPHRLSLAYKALILGHAQDKPPDYGTVVFGPDLTTARIRLAPHLEAVSQIVQSLLAQVEGTIVPTLCLNRHCGACQFKEQCYAEARSADHLSLLRGLTAKEIARHNHKGIFTVTQLSHTFRSRRRSPRSGKAAALPHSYALQALALREKTVYVHGSPDIPAARTRIFFDVESLPDRDFDYLIGMLVCQDSSPRQYSFWADSKQQERDIYVDALETLRSCDDYVLFHYGNYEQAALQRMESRLPLEYKALITEIRKRTVNLLSTVYSHVYFPTWSHGLKDICRCLGFEWSSDEVDGLRSIVWREEWDRI